VLMLTLRLSCGGIAPQSRTGQGKAGRQARCGNGNKQKEEVGTSVGGSDVRRGASFLNIMTPRPISKRPVGCRGEWGGYNLLVNGRAT
jgi:hypothetical protein